MPLTNFGDRMNVSLDLARTHWKLRRRRLGSRKNRSFITAFRAGDVQVVVFESVLSTISRQKNVILLDRLIYMPICESRDRLL